MKSGFKYILILTFLIGSFPICHSQGNSRAIDSLVTVLRTQKDDSNKVNTLNKLSYRLRIIDKFDSSLLFAEQAQQLADKIEFKKGTAEALRNTGMIYFGQNNYSQAHQYLLKALAINQQLGNKKGIETTLGNIGLIFWKLGNYAKALEYYFNALSIAQQIDNKADASADLDNIGIVYLEQTNYPKSLQYQLEALAAAEVTGNKTSILSILGNIGNIYYEQGNFPKTLEYYLKALSMAQKIGDKDDLAVGYGNIGSVYGDQGNYTKALEYYFNAISLTKQSGNKDDLASLYSRLGGIYIKLKNYKRAKSLLDSALTMSKNIGDKRYIRDTYFKLAILDSSTGNEKASYANYKNYMCYRDSLVNQESVMKITQMELNKKFEKTQDSIRTEQEKVDIIKTSEINRKRIITNSVIVILTLILLLAVLFINRQQIKRKKDTLLFEREKHRMELELANAKTMLDEFTRNLIERNDLIEQVQTDLEKIKGLKSKEIAEERTEYLDTLNKASILTEEDWIKFKDLFDRVHKGFLIRLKEKLPDITQAEVRLICLTKLKLDTKHMAGILGVSVSTIWQSRYRLRKKLGLSEEGGLDSVVESI